MKIETVFLVLFVSLGGFASVEPNSSLSPTEQERIIKKVKQIYSGISAEVNLFDRPVKYSLKEGSEVSPHSFLKKAEEEENPKTLQFLAQKKLDTEFLEYQCRWSKTKFLKIRCGVDDTGKTWEGMTASENVSKLTETWLDNPSRMIGELPVKGKTSIPLWSDDYWKLEWGGTSYRYGDALYFSDYRRAVKSYLQPDDWFKARNNPNIEQLNKEIERWSPAEKYDLITNNLRFDLTQEQKAEGEFYLDENGDVEGWMGLCHGWAAAAIMAPKAISSVSLWGPSGTQVKLFPHDVRALTTLAWANGYYSTNFVGQRCNRRNPETFSNGRVRDSDCFDNNPGVFHLALGNLIGLAEASFVMDAAFDYQVWNQPVAAYEFTFFNPLNPNELSKEWEDVAVRYDSIFKAKDPFQNPLTRGVRADSGTRYDDSGIEKVVGVIATVVYLGEVRPAHGDVARDENFIRVSYTYDLELQSNGEGYEIIGGEWHTNAHPDFLWVPKRGSVASTDYDFPSLTFNGRETPIGEVSHRASAASRNGYPLCSVLSTLLKESSSDAHYICP